MENINVFELNYPYLNNMDYTTQQLILPLDLGKKLNSSDPVFSFLKVMEGVNWNTYLNRPSHKGREEYNPFKMIKIVLFAFMNKIYSLRGIEQACKTDIRFMYLMEEETPSHMAIQRFIEKYLKDSIENIFKDIFESICTLDDVDTKTLCIDGTKLEANATKFSFVWKKTAVKTRDKTFTRINDEIQKLENTEPKDTWAPEELDVILEAILSQCKKQGFSFVYGKGKRKTPIQRIYDNLADYRDTLESCLTRIQICGEGRNSYSKTDHDATMMHMKEDYYMKTGIFKPGYNVQIGVCDEYIAYACVFQERSDQKTFIKFLDRYLEQYRKLPAVVVADAGYGSYDNYMYCLTHNIEAYIKYSMYSKEKEKKYKKNLYNKANWMKDTSGRYICPAGHVFTCISERVDKRSKYMRINQSHSCGKCETCEQKNVCTTAKRNRIITVNPILNELQTEAKKRLDSEEGIQLRMKRSIETEGAFGVIKTDNKYDRIHRRSIKNVEMEIQLVSIGFNLIKYHNKKQRPNYSA